MDMVTGTWDAAAVAIITDGAEAAVITMDGHAADTADGISCEHMRSNRVRSLKRSSNGNKKGGPSAAEQKLEAPVFRSLFAWLRQGWPNLEPPECGLASELFEVGLHSSRLKGAIGT